MIDGSWIMPDRFDAIANKPGVYSARLDGACMEPEYTKDTVIIANPNEPFGPGDDVVIWLVTGYPSFKRCVRKTRRFLEVAAINPPEKMRMGWHTISMVHRVVGHADISECEQVEKLV